MDHGWLPWSLLALVLLAAAIFGRVGLLWLTDRRRQARGGQQLGPATKRPERPMTAPETPPPSGGKRWLT